jgi:hypothetical protein
MVEGLFRLIVGTRTFSLLNFTPALRVTLRLDHSKSPVFTEVLTGLRVK